ncbi:MAG: hypothetical protein ACKO5E_18270, partial [bacterium]
RSGPPGRDIYAAFNASAATLFFTIPKSPSGRAWRLVVNTSAEPPADYFEPDTGPVVTPGTPVPLPDRSMIVLVSCEE